MSTKKLIEVALPLEKINAESAREKSIRHGHPSSLHLWWARRPLAAARAVIWASLVDDPSSHPELYPTEEEQNEERQRLFKILEDLVVWENANNNDVLDAAKKEIIKNVNGSMPALLDPFAGGGAIPLEAQRLGLKAYASDLNPIAVMINKAMIQIPALFSNKSPVNPEARIEKLQEGWTKASGIAEDVRFYGELMRKEAFSRVGYLYPTVKVPQNLGGGRATVIAWIWARTVRCPNPACACETPLAHSFVLSKKKGKEAWTEPVYENKELHFIVHNNTSSIIEGTIDRKGAICALCGNPISYSYIRSESVEGHMGARLMGVIAEGANGRVYLSPDKEQETAAVITLPEKKPEGELAYYPGHLNTNVYGLNEFYKLFTPRQLTTLMTFSSLVPELKKRIELDAIEAGLADDHIPLQQGGTGAAAYGEAISVYLAFLVDQLTNQSASVCGWNNVNTQMRCVFSRQAIPMVWDYAECNLFSNSSGSFNNMFQLMTRAFDLLGSGIPGTVDQMDAQKDCGLRNIMVSTDPPYYDNIGYADLSDFFYVWMRQSLKDIFPDLFATMLVPKQEELIATPYRHNGDVHKAKSFFEQGMLETCKRIYEYTNDDIPVTIYYAYKQSEVDSKDKTNASTGWETMLSSIIRSGFVLTGTWPIRTEKPGRSIGNGANALASSIVLVCRKRNENAPQTTRRTFIGTLRRELHPALKKLQESNIAPVDLAQSAIGPGMGVFSRYKKVLEADGTPMTVRSALQVINEELDLYFNEQVGDLDAMSRFCVDLYTQNAFNEIKFGDADILASAKGTSVTTLASHCVVYAKAGTVHLIERNELPENIDDNENCIWMLTQQLTQAMATGGVEACAKTVSKMLGSNAERAKDLAYRLYTIAEQKKWSTEAFAYNALVVAWPDIQSRAAMMQRETPEQMDMFSMGLLDT